MNPIHRWITAHPYWSITLAWHFGALSVTAAYSDSLASYAAITFGCQLILWLLWVRIWAVTSILLATALLAAQPAKANEPQPALPYMIGAVVVIIGGVVTYKLVKYCQKNFPKNPPQTNDPPALATDDAYAAAFSYAPAGSCYQPASEQSAQLLEVRARLLPGPTLRVESALSLTNQTQDATAWEADLAAWGLSMNPHGSSQSFSLNGAPIAAEASPIHLSSNPPSIDLDGAAAKILVEKSYDLLEWSPVFVTSVPEGRELRFQDASSTSQLFYRLTLLAP